MPSLRTLRIRAAMTAALLSNKSGVAQSTIYAIEGGRELPSIPTAHKLAKALGVKPAEIDEVKASLERMESSSRKAPDHAN